MGIGAVSAAKNDEKLIRCIMIWVLKPAKKSCCFAFGTRELPFPVTTTNEEGK
jgi:hypothetical protein